MKYILFGLLIASLWLLASPWLSAPRASATDVVLENPIRANDLEQLIMQITNYLLGLTGALMMIFLIISGYRYMTAGGNEDRARNAKKSIQWTIVGIVIILASGIIVNSIIRALGRQ